MNVFTTTSYSSYCSNNSIHHDHAINNGGILLEAY